MRRACPVCGVDRWQLLREVETWRLVRCAECELVYLPEVPSAEAVETEFEWSRSFDRERAAREKRNGVFRRWTRMVNRLRPSRERRAFRRIRRLAPPGRMLDVGCGDGRLDLEALGAGYDVIGVELSPIMADKARKRIGANRVRCGRLNDFQFPPGSFDLAVTVSYLEHEPDPGSIVAQILELLRPGGIFINKVPNYASWLRGGLGWRWSGFRFPEHVQYFTPRTLGRLLKNAGFDRVRTSVNPLSDNFWCVCRRVE